MSVIPFPKPTSQRQDRILERIPVVRYIAHRVFENLFAPIQEKDLQGVGFLALVEACDKFENVPVTEFDLRVKLSIRSAILDDVKKSISRHEHLYGLAITPRPLRTNGRAAKGEPHPADLRRALDGLPNRQRLILELRLEGRTQREVAEYLGIKQRDLARIEARAVATLRGRMNPVELRKAA